MRYACLYSIEEVDSGEGGSIDLENQVARAPAPGGGGGVLDRLTG